MNGRRIRSISGLLMVGGAMIALAGCGDEGTSTVAGGGPAWAEECQARNEPVPPSRRPEFVDQAVPSDVIGGPVVFAVAQSNEKGGTRAADGTTFRYQQTFIVTEPVSVTTRIRATGIGPATPAGTIPPGPTFTRKHPDVVSTTLTFPAQGCWDVTTDDGDVESTYSVAVWDEDSPAG